MLKTKEWFNITFKNMCYLKNYLGKMQFTALVAFDTFELLYYDHEFCISNKFCECKLGVYLITINAGAHT